MSERATDSQTDRLTQSALRQNQETKRGLNHCTGTHTRTHAQHHETKGGDPTGQTDQARANTATHPPTTDRQTNSQGGGGVVLRVRESFLSFSVVPSFHRLADPYDETHTHKHKQTNERTTVGVGRVSIGLPHTQTRRGSWVTANKQTHLREP